MSRAVRSLIILTALAVLATGQAAQALSAPPGVGADIWFGASMLLLVTSFALLVRVFRHLTRTPTSRRS